MTTDNPTKRRRGGQIGNQNAKGNRGNLTARRHCFEHGNRLGGAPFGNQNARKRPAAPHAILLEDYKNQPEATAWIEAHKEVLKDASFTADDQRDCAVYSGYCGLTPESLAESGQEYRLGLFTVMRIDAYDNGSLRVNSLRKVLR
jgi:hypothetical protein